MGLLLFIQLLSFVLLVPDTVTSCGENPCYLDLGCFPNNDPWCTLTRPVPVVRTPEQIQTVFYLYTRSNPARFIVPIRPTISLTGSGFNSSLRSVFVVHGYESSANKTHILGIKDAILSAIDVNVFLIDWNSQLNYEQEVSDARVIGREMARFGLFLLNNYPNTTPASFYPIGHSLGAHICSYMGKNITGISRITALDPAQLLFEGNSNEVHITPGDAKYVDVIHTDAMVGGFGMINPTGDVDFYVNGGSLQPGCLNDPTTIVASGIFYLSCSHKRSILVFTDAVQDPNCTFWGHSTTFNFRYLYRTVDAPPCTLNTCTPIGLQTFDYPARDNGNVFYVGTTGTSPYCNPADQTGIA